MRTIKVKGYLDVKEEYPAHDATIRPGMLVELTSADKVQKHGTAAGPVLPMFAAEDELQGHGIDDLYDTDDIVQVLIPTRGDQVYALLDDEEDITRGDFLVSAGNGRLQKYDAVAFSSDEAGSVDANVIVGVALETIDMGSSTDEWPDTGRRIKVRII